MIARPVDPACKLPLDLQQPVWRYMDLEKFKYLIEHKALYLCRADKLQDKFEGSYSRQQITDMNDWLGSKGYHDIVKSEERHRVKTRASTYINCWCMSSCDYDLMWKGYVPKEHGVAIKSTVKELQNLCNQNVEHWPLDISVVTYVDQVAGSFIDYPGLSPYLHKDNHFSLDKEIRILQSVNWSDPTPDHLDLPVNPQELIHSIVLAPVLAAQSAVSEVKHILDKHGFASLPVVFSRYNRDE